MPIALRSDYDAAWVRAVAHGSHNAGETRRLLALAAIYDGATRTEAAAMVRRRGCPGVPGRSGTAKCSAHLQADGMRLASPDRRIKIDGTD